MKQYKVIHRIASGYEVVVETDNPDRVIRQSFSVDIPRGDFPRWLPLQGQDVEVTVIDQRRSGQFRYENGRHVRVV